MSSSAVIEEMLDDLEEFVNLTDGVGDMLEQLHELGEAIAPVPDGELVVLLAGTLRTAAPVGSAMGAPARPHTGARRSVLVGLAVAVVVAMGITSAAAAVNELPASMQRAVAHFSETYLPFSFPRPVGDPPAGGEVGRRTDVGSTGASQGTRTDGSSVAHRRDAAAKARAQALSAARAKARAEAAAEARAKAKAHAHEARTVSSEEPESSLPEGEDGSGSPGSGGSEHDPSTDGGDSGAGQGTGTGTGGSTHAHEGHSNAGHGGDGGGAGSEVHPGKPTSGEGSGRGASATSGPGTSR